MKVGRFSGMRGVGILLSMLLLLLTGCAVTPPDQGAGAGLATLDAEQSAAPLSTGDSSMPVEQTAADTGAPEAEATDPPSPTAAPAPAAGEITGVDLFIDATFPMMGFADTPTVSLYERTIDALHTGIARAYPQAERRSYRADLERDSLAGALLSEATLAQDAANPSFYLIQPLTHLPERVQRAGQSAPQQGGRMNEFLPGYYDESGTALPGGARETATPATWAVSHSEVAPDRLTLILTDLSELQLHTGPLTQALRQYGFREHCTVGLLALRSEFSGLVPVESAETVWYEWGALPTGAREKLLDYGPYTLGITQEAADRGEETRPCYLLCLGEGGAVRNLLEVVQHQLETSLAQQQLSTYLTVYDLDFAGAPQALAARLTGTSRGGINVSATELAQTGTSYVQLQRVNAGEERAVEFTMPYAPGPTDSRVGSFGAEDFTARVRLYALAEDGGRGAEVQPRGQGIPLTLSATEEGGRVVLAVRLTFPQGSVPRGDYLVEVALTLFPPPANPLPDWAAEIGADLTEQQRTGAFDGGKTIGLTGLLNALSGMQGELLAPAELGSFTFPLYVVVDED